MNLDLYHRLWAGDSLTRVLAGQSLWQLTGPDRIRYLNGQVTNDVAALPTGEACLAAVCTAKGRMEGAVHIAPHGDELYLDADPALHDTLGARLEKYLIADDASLEDVSGLWTLSHVFGRTPPAQPDTGFVIHHARYGLPGYDVWIPGCGAVVVGETVEADVVETVRIEHAVPVWGAELTAQTLPPEAGPVMLAAISYTKGCYVGQETIARLKSVGHVNRTLVFLRSESAVFPVRGASLVLGEKEIGVVTSSGFSPRLKTGIALGYVQLAASAVGTSLRCDDLVVNVDQPLKPEGAS
jgi:folate-binding protein YgfZ